MVVEQADGGVTLYFLGQHNYKNQLLIQNFIYQHRTAAKEHCDLCAISTVALEDPGYKLLFGCND